MTRTKQTRGLKPILVSLPISVIQELDNASSSLNCSRSHLIRRSLNRDLRYVVEHEVVEASKLQQKAKDSYARWLKADQRKKPSVKMMGFKEWLIKELEAEQASSSVPSNISDQKKRSALCSFITNGRMSSKGRNW